MAHSTWKVSQRLLAMIAAMVLGTGLLAAPADAARPGVRWDSDGMAEIPAPPFTFSLELTDYSSPQEIDREGDVRVDFSAVVDIAVCSATLKATPLRNGLPVGEPAYTDPTDDYDYVALWFPYGPLGTYSLQVEGSYETSPSILCAPGSTTSTPYSTTIDLFQLDAPLPGPPSTRPVTITSTGPHTLVANTWRKSSPIPIAFSIKDPEKRKDLFHSICMTDVYDCWFEDEALKPQSSIRRTATGWIRSWGFWWERTSPSDCYSYAWNQPDVSVILVVSNSDGKVLGRKKHSVKLTCR